MYMFFIKKFKKKFKAFCLIFFRFFVLFVCSLSCLKKDGFEFFVCGCHCLLYLTIPTSPSLQFSNFFSLLLLPFF
jgi:hypothetical protein